MHVKSYKERPLKNVLWRNNILIIIKFLLKFIGIFIKVSKEQLMPLITRFYLCSVKITKPLLIFLRLLAKF